MRKRVKWRCLVCCSFRPLVVRRIILFFVPFLFHADLDKVNPGSVILSGEMMLRYMGWLEAADAIIGAMDRTIAQKTVTYDFARLMDGATEVKCSEFGDMMIRNL